jgi:hypothetical protein
MPYKAFVKSVLNRIDGYFGRIKIIRNVKLHLSPVFINYQSIVVNTLVISPIFVFIY